MEQNSQRLIETLLTSNLSLSQYQKTQQILLSMEDKETIFSQIGYCSACNTWYRLYDMAGFEVCDHCMHYR